MARSPRRDLIDATEVGVNLCVQRAVRRAWLCVEDPVTGKNLDHRKVWTLESLAFLAGQTTAGSRAQPFHLSRRPIHDP